MTVRLAGVDRASRPPRFFVAPPCASRPRATLWTPRAPPVARRAPWRQLPGERQPSGGARKCLRFTLGKQLAPESCDMCRWRRQPPGVAATANALSGRSMRLGAEAVLPTLPAVHLSRRKAAMLERSELPARMRRELAGARTPHVCRTGCAHHRHSAGTPWAHRLRTCLTGRLRSASQVEWGRGLEVDLDANVFSRRFCSCTSRSGQLIRYAWQAIGLQSWCGKTASRHNSTCTRPMARAAAREPRPNLTHPSLFPHAQ